MNKKRQKDRINLRFADKKFMDDLELLAYSQGLTSSAFASACIKKAVRDAKEQEQMFILMFQCTLRMYYVMELYCTHEQLTSSKQKEAAISNQIAQS